MFKTIHVRDKFYAFAGIPESGAPGTSVSKYHMVNPALATATATLLGPQWKICVKHCSLGHIAAEMEPVRIFLPDR